MKKTLLFTLLLLFNAAAQNAADYFPSATGFKWYYKSAPYDSLNHLLDTLTYYEIDSFSTSMDYLGKPANLILGKTGSPSEILQLPYIDSNFVHLETTNIWNYFTGLDYGGFGFDYEGWYSVYRLNSSTSTTYTIFTKDTLVSDTTLSYTLRIEVTGKRLSDQVISTPYGMMNCKKFLLKPTVKIIPQILPIPLTLFTINDTVYIAPGYYVVKEVRPSTNVDLSFLGLGAFYIPGELTEAITPPPVLQLNASSINVSADGDTSFIIITNSGEGTLQWTAQILDGSDWISFYGMSSGIQGDSLFIAFAKNTTLLPRTGFLAVYSEGSFNSPQYISVFQEPGLPVSVNDENQSPQNYFLGQNFPNPFNPETNISFSLKLPGFAAIILYDMLGNEVSKIAGGNYSAGIHNIKFDAEGLSSGMYIYKIISNGFTASRKMVILK